MVYRIIIYVYDSDGVLIESLNGRTTFNSFFSIINCIVKVLRKSRFMPHNFTCDYHLSVHICKVSPREPDNLFM